MEIKKEFENQMWLLNRINEHKELSCEDLQDIAVACEALLISLREVGVEV